ncbi:rhomboid family intramembrane serine protease [soil metagenome]|nr:rhomboid family intramembrane serine protease [Actinomycetota bacterium]
MTDPREPGPPAERGEAPAAPTCYRHTDRETYIRCTRCERPICPDCMQPAAVGFQCPECVRAGNRSQRSARTVFGGQPSADPGTVTRVLIGINVVLFLVQLAAPALTQRLFLIGLALDPSSGQLVGVADGEYYRLVTVAFLHGGFLHLLFNMYALFLFGPRLEAVLGRGRFLTLYLLSALGGSVASYLTSAPNQPSVGASGAVFGLLGALLVVSRKLRYDARPVLVLLGINLALGFVIPRIDWRAHLGGLVAGALLAAVFAYAPQRLRQPAALAAVGVVMAVFAVLVVLRTTALTG